MVKRVLLLGGCGGFGRAFAKQLNSQNIGRTSVDVSESADIVCDILSQPKVLVEALENHDVLLMCTAEPTTMATLKVLDDFELKDKLLVDICSVKTNVCQLAENTDKDCEYLSIYPMFGPDRQFAQQNMVVIEVRGETLSKAFQQLLGNMQVKLLEATAATHDQVTAMVQVLTHATLISFAQAQSQLQVPQALFDAMATPIFKSLDDTAQGLLGENPSLYHNIQTANPNGTLGRQALLEAAQQVVSVLGQEDVQQVVELFERLRRN